MQDKKFLFMMKSKPSFTHDIYLQGDLASNAAEGRICVLVTQIRDRFDQDGYQMYSKLEQLLQKRCDDRCSNEVLNFHGDDCEGQSTGTTRQLP